MNKLNIIGWLLIFLGIVILIFCGGDLRFGYTASIIAVIGAIMLL